jgi:hypothetical protein
MRKYSYWEIVVGSDGSFTLYAVDPINYTYQSQTVSKPSWLPNMYNDWGYVTLTANKLASEVLTPEPYLHADEVKVYQ